MPPQPKASWSSSLPAPSAPPASVSKEPPHWYAPKGVISKRLWCSTSTSPWAWRAGIMRTQDSPATASRRVTRRCTLPPAVRFGNGPRYCGRQSPPSPVRRWGTIGPWCRRNVRMAAGLAEGQRRSLSEHRVPFVPNAHHGPAPARGERKCPFGPGTVAEFAGWVVVPDQQAEDRPPWVAGVLQHGNIGVGVAHREDGPPPDPAPDPDRLGGTVVEHVGEGAEDHRNSPWAFPVAQGAGPADHPLGRDPVGRLGEGAHEVPVPTG